MMRTRRKKMQRGNWRLCCLRVILAVAMAGIYAWGSGGFSVQAQGGNMQLGAVAAGAVVPEGEELKVYVAVQVLPGAAGLDHINVQFKNPANDRSVTKILRPKDQSNGIYAGWITMSLFEPAGTYVLDKVLLQDENGNYVKYRRAEDREEEDHYLTLPVTAAFQINNGVVILDETPPALGAVAITPTEAGKESEIRVAAAVADDFSGVDSVTVRFENEHGQTLSLNLEADGELYTGMVKKNQTKDKGTYLVKKVTVTDRMGNSRIYYGGDGPFASGVGFVIR